MCFLEDCSPIGRELTKPSKRQPHKMFKHTQTILWQQPTNCLSVFNHYVELTLKGLRINSLFTPEQCGQYSLYSATKNSITRDLRSICKLNKLK